MHDEMRVCQARWSRGGEHGSEALALPRREWFPIAACQSTDHL